MYTFQNSAASIKTGFSCFNRTIGFYADINSHCKIYHTCDEYGNKFTYRCPEETAFRQDALICDHAHLVRCQGNASNKAEEHTEEDKNYNFSFVTNSANRNHTLPQSYDRSQLKINSRIQYGFVFRPQEPRKNISKTGTAENKVTNSFYPLNHTHNTTRTLISHITNPTTQNVSTINQNHKSGLRTSGNISTQSDGLYSGDKHNEKQETDEKEYTTRKVNAALHNFLKLPSNMYPGNIQYPVKNIETSQSIKSTNDAAKLPSVNYRDYPYLETLKSIQKNTITPSTMISTTIRNVAFTTTELPVYALTLSLKPLIPSELEYDPYYPKFSMSTESYYTSTHNIKESSQIGSTIQTKWSNLQFELPPVLPDLNSLEDIVDRRKLLYIPRVKFN